MSASLRRSARIRDLPQEVPAQEPASDEATSERDVSAPRRKPKKTYKRRKVEVKPYNEAPGDPPAQPVIARPDKPGVRGRRGLLQFMTEIPLDTLHDIFRELDPADLLHLSWASKSLNSIVMEKSARYIWEEAFERIYELETPPPRCPEDINLAQYARFLYEKTCMLCGSYHGYYTSWMMRLRACWNCLNSDRFSNYMDYVEERHLLTITASANFALRTITRISMMSERPQSVWRQWESKRSECRREELSQLRLKRENEYLILSKLDELGWTTSKIEEVINGNIADIAEELPGFKSSRKLTKSEWKELQPKIVTNLEELRKARLERQRRARLWQRWQSFKDLFKVWAESQNMENYWKPRPLDIALVDPFKTVIFLSDEEDPAFDIEEIDRIAKTWFRSRNDCFISVLPQDVQTALAAVSEKDENNKLILLHLAYLLFDFPASYYSSSTIADVCERNCWQWNFPQMEDGTLHQAIIDLRISSSDLPWKPSGFEFNSKASAIAKDVITLFGLDPLKTTLSEMRSSSLTLKCAGLCESSWCSGRGASWFHIVQHDMKYNGDLPISARWKSEIPYQESENPSDAKETSN
ncbi:hypothetical protein NP233_g6514 [Leucocoprinus birnbaumii]|uniref:F-box domain-containing protein n=1 Tax=Leucocoprinus birnbaumii TaxID=56174 RepID=A0AAD5VR14_9AGAR|nr:hypothetical protein NP233_g6514 [Leucocoprinus birnbaumii]